MKVIFMGTPDFAVSTLNAIVEAGHEVILVVTQPDKPKGRGKEMAFSDVKSWAIEHDLPVFQPVRIREEEAIAELRKYNADIFVVAAFGQILPKEILDMPRFGCINVHASLLPKYRGAAPIQWSILNGEETTGVTIMQMGIGLDDGDMLSVREVKIEADDTGGSLFDKLAVIGGELCVKTMMDIEEGKVIPVPQNEERATKVGMIKKELGFINFSKPAEVIERYVRGLNPWPSAYTYYGGKTLKIWKAKVLSESELADKTEIAGINDRHPGEVVYASDKEVIVKTGVGYLCLLEIQLEGKKRMGIEDFLRGRKITQGEILG